MKLKATPEQWAELQRLLREYRTELEMTLAILRDVLAGVERAQSAAGGEQPEEKKP